MRYNLLAVILLFISLALNFKPVEQSFVAVQLKSVAASLAYPVNGAISLVSKEIKQSGLFLINAYGSQQKIKDYERRLKELQSQAILLKRFETENESLRSALQFKSSSRYSLVGANIIGRDNKTWNSMIIVDAGTEKGIRAGLTVISTQGLVGRVVESFENYSKIMLITSSQSSIGIMLPKENIFGIAYGGFGNRLVLQYIPESASIEVSDSVVVSSSSSLYLPGISVGKVSKIDKNVDNIFQKVEIDTSTNFSKIGIIFICKPY